jgi:phosphoserine phosphatase RsbU/P
MGGRDARFYIGRSMVCLEVLVMNPETPASAAAPMRCMEIRGDYRAVEDAFETPGLLAWILSRPYQGAERGGDVHYISLCGGGVITRLVIADVSGHGADVSGFSHVLRALMRKNINTKSQTRLLRSLNRQFGESAQLQKFATAVIATFLATRKSLTICNAGHPRPLWRHAKTKRWMLLDKTAVEPGNLPLGVDDASTYHQFAVRLEPRDVVLFYTDALTEAEDPLGRLLGEEGLLNLARGLDPSDPREFGRTLMAAIENYRGGKPADDDVTLLVLMHNGGGSRPPKLSEKLDVYAKVFGLRDY